MKGLVLLVAAVLAQAGCSTSGHVLDPVHTQGVELSPEVRPEPVGPGTGRRTLSRDNPFPQHAVWKTTAGSRGGAAW